MLLFTGTALSLGCLFIAIKNKKPMQIILAILVSLIAIYNWL